ncbi:MAG: RNA 2'-phosphotransferase [Bacteroidota bacterium]
MKDKQLSKFLSLVLRHQPEIIGLELDGAGWANLDELLQKLQTKDAKITKFQIKKIVAENDKQRFKIDASLNRIRANQGHSIAVNLELEAVSPPSILYHGTAERFLPPILAQGLQKGSRRHVHLTDQIATAKKVGRRHGRPVLLLIDAQQMQAAGQSFYLSENGVWLTDNVAPEYLQQKTWI